MCIISRDIFPTSGNVFQGHPPTSYAQSHSFSPGNNGDSLPLHHASEYELEDAVPESAVSSYEDAADLDIIESTTGFLVAASIPLNHDQVGVSCVDIADDILINSQAVDNELQNFEVGHVPDKPQDVVKEEAQSSSEDESIAAKSSVPEPGPEREISIVQQRPPVLTPCYTGKKRGRKPKRKGRGRSVASYESKSEGLKIRRLD